MCSRHDLGRLDIRYDYERVKEALPRKSLRSRGHDVWRYRELLPVDEKHAARLGEGNTPLIRAERLGSELGLKQLYIKDETRNPSASYKDRSMAVGVAKAIELGIKKAITASSGNAAASLAAYCAKAGIECVALVLESASREKTAQLSMYGAKVVKVKSDGSKGDPTVKLLLKASMKLGFYPCPSFGPFNPYQVEGPKTISYELLEQSHQAFDWILVPTGSACLLTGIWKGFNDLASIGWSDEYPALAAVQPKGNSPLVKAFQRGLFFRELRPEPNPSTIATGLADPFPWDGDAGLTALRKSGGVGVAVYDDAIIDSVRKLARLEGVFAEPSGAAGIAGLIELRKMGYIGHADRVCVLVTGSGLKDVDSLSKLSREPPTIGPSTKELEGFLKGHSK